jgi:thiol-disulfide isomerase/thioredoxin
MKAMASSAANSVVGFMFARWSPAHCNSARLAAPRLAYDSAHEKGAMIVVAIAIAAAQASSAQRNRTLIAQVAHCAYRRASPPRPDPPARLEAVVPDVLPVVERDREGRSAGFRMGRQPVMVNFWATWCGPCRREIPLLNKVHAERAKQKVEIIGIAVDFRDDVLAYAQQTPISYPLLIGEEDGLAAVQAFGMQPNFPSPCCRKQTAPAPCR